MYCLSPLGTLLTLVTLLRLEVLWVGLFSEVTSSIGLSVGDESLGHYSEVGCISEERLSIEVLL